MEKRVGIFKMAPAALDNQFRSLMFIVDVLSGTGFIEFSIKAEIKEININGLPPPERYHSCPEDLCT